MCALASTSAGRALPSQRHSPSLRIHLRRLLSAILSRLSCSQNFPQHQAGGPCITATYGWFGNVGSGTRHSFVFQCVSRVRARVCVCVCVCVCYLCFLCSFLCVGVFFVCVLCVSRQFLAVQHAGPFERNMVISDVTYQQADDVNDNKAIAVRLCFVPASCSLRPGGLLQPLRSPTDLLQKAAPPKLATLEAVKWDMLMSAET